MRINFSQDQISDFIAACKFDISKLLPILPALINDHSEYICNTCSHKKRDYDGDKWKLCDFKPDELNFCYNSSFLVAPIRCEAWMKYQYMIKKIHENFL